MTTSSKRLGFMAMGILLLLLVPLVAMQFTNEVQWSAFDFLVMGTLLIFLAGGLELIIRNVGRNTLRYLLIAILIFIFLLVWGELAVGIFGTPFAGS